MHDECMARGNFAIDLATGRPKVFEKTTGMGMGGGLCWGPKGGVTEVCLEHSNNIGEWAA